MSYSMLTEEQSKNIERLAAIHKAIVALNEAILINSADCSATMVRETVISMAERRRAMDARFKDVREY